MFLDIAAACELAKLLACQLAKETSMPLPVPLQQPVLQFVFVCQLQDVMLACLLLFCAPEQWQ